MSLLIVGGTGTLGRQIVLQAVKRGYKVRCLVRNFIKAKFLKDLGVELVYGDLSCPETIPFCLIGITAIIDASTGRFNELDSLKEVDWKGKLYLMKAAKAASIKRYILFSTQNVELFENLPLMQLKLSTEQKLQKSNVKYTIFRLSAFHQGLIQQYAIPILENSPVWITNPYAEISYMDTQEIAVFVIRSLQLPETVNQTYTLSGLEGCTSSEILGICQTLAGQKAKVRRVPIILLMLLSDFFGLFEWGVGISNRLAFVVVLNTPNSSARTTFEVYQKFKFKLDDLVELDVYFLEYFSRLVKRLRDIDFEDIERQKNLII